MSTLGSDAQPDFRSAMARIGVIFHDPRTLGTKPPGGELWLVADPDSPRRDLANRILERGLEGLWRGTGPVRRIIVQRNPTFDDMLACELAKHLCCGADLPAGVAAFAECAKLIREGLRPGELPIERSIEGIFLAVLNRDGPEQDLTDPVQGGGFYREWSRMARRVLDAAAQGLDPVRTPLSVLPDK